MFKKSGGLDPFVVHSFEQHWPIIQDVIKRMVLNEHISKLEWHNLFDDVHMICVWDEEGSYKLSKALEAEFNESLISDIGARLLSIEDGYQQLKEYVNQWNKFRQHCRWFPLAFQQLDLANKNSNVTVRDLMLKLWNSNIVEILNHRLQNSAMELINSERNGHIIDSQLLIGFRESYTYLQDLKPNRLNYLKQFQELFIRSIEVYYSTKANEFLKEEGVLNYIKWALDKLEKEERRAELYLGPDAVQSVSNACKETLVKDFVEQVLAEFSLHIRANHHGYIKLIFQFVDRVEGFGDKLLEKLCKHIVTSGLSSMSNSSSSDIDNCEKFVNKVLDSYHKFELMIKESFNDDRRAKRILEKAFKMIVNNASVFQANPITIELNSPSPGPPCVKNNNNNQPEPRCSELLANYCNLLLRRNTFTRKLTLNDISERLDDVLLIIKFVKDKDTFIKYHKIHLTRRLILNTTIGIDQEEQFVTSLKKTGLTAEQLHKLVRMFKDFEASEDILRQYKRTLQPLSNMKIDNNDNNNTIQTLDSQIAASLYPQDNNNKTATTQNCDLVNIKILNPSAWAKTNDSFSISLPDEITSILPSIEAFYCNQFSGRKLDWCHQLSYGTMTFTSDNGEYDLEVTAAQLSILSAYNEQPEEAKAFKDLESLSGLSQPDLKRTLWSLVSNPKLKIQLMHCEPRLNNIKDMDVEKSKFNLNLKFELIKNGKPQSKGRVSLIGRLQI